MVQAKSKPADAAPASRKSSGASPRKKERARPSRFLTAAIAFAGLAVLSWLLWENLRAKNRVEVTVSKFQLQDIPFSGKRAYEYLKQLCAIGPRCSGSPGMTAQQKLIEKHFKKLGAVVEYQRFHISHPVDASAVEMANMLIHWHPKAKKRILLCAHYDTLPFPMLDPINPRGVFLGANDNASGVAVLMELGNEISNAKIPCKYGIDFLMIDGEEFIFSPSGRFFIGSEYFARAYVKKPPPYRYRWGVLLDMIGDKDLQIYQEHNSMIWRDTRPLVRQIWATAARLGVKEFILHRKHEMLDDHLMLHNLGRIACIDVIDYDYPPWHTTGDTPDKCSALSLAKVGWVIREWLKTVK